MNSASLELWLSPLHEGGHALFLVLGAEEQTHRFHFKGQTGIKMGFQGFVNGCFGPAHGKGRACELIFTGDMISAEEAERIGLVNRVVLPKELMKTARAMAAKIASRAPLAVGRAKTAINKTLETDLDDGLAFEVESVCLLFSTEDKEEGMAAFVERRKPEFKGR